MKESFLILRKPRAIPASHADTAAWLHWIKLI